MKLFIENGTLTEDLRKIFTNCYPFLKIELYKKQFANGLSTIKKAPLAPALNLAKFINAAKKITIDINKNVTVAELENQFEDIGLMAEVFRKSGNMWIETTLTNNWTLQQQNTEGEEISRHFNSKEIDSSNLN